ncbi:ABC transporter ATP-binding protein [Butyrivibrio sp. FC2001]|jgi:oligopeptide/dipeptide ABC transporter ATP-binding protein|uniref:ABC transporter ATP-binding protein n=1 Tax=Butyrivibrio sp. FC2001 TaxID=1280671 RepID=UPI00041D624E|nr:ABC transporter ATP-binding protein [Butyrivibrio sp. FC2001]
MNEDILLELKDVTVSVKKKKDTVPLVKHINLTIPKRGIVGLVGESGSGKSLTAKSINHILPPFVSVTDGQILWHEESGDVCDLVPLSEKDIRKRCGTDVAMIFQEPMTSLNPMMCIGDQIKEVLMIHKLEKDQARAKARVIEMLDAVGIKEPERRYKSWPHELSGGQRQRVMIAMAMIGSPRLLIADEPTTALDVTIEAQILKLIRKMSEDYSMSTLVITHNLGVVSTICDYVYVMYLGSIMEQAPVQELFRNPVHPYTKGLLSSIPRVGDNPEFLETIPGNIPIAARNLKGCEFCLRCSDDIKKCFFEKAEMKKVGEDHYVRCHSIG